MKSLEDLVEDGIRTVESGFYEVDDNTFRSFSSSILISNRRSLVKAIRNKKKTRIVCEIKFASPSAGSINTNYNQVSEIARKMEYGGAVALSVLTEPKNFNGSITNLIRVREASSLPVIMKDVIVSKEQIKAAARIGASAVLLIEEVFSECNTKDDLTLTGAINLAKNLGLEVIVETHSKKGLRSAMDSESDIVGINNRDLKTFQTNTETTLNLLRGLMRRSEDSKLLMSESGFETPEQIAKLVRELRSHHWVIPDAFLIGTSIMKSVAIESKVRGFVEALSTS